jgi:hypothetical protein
MNPTLAPITDGVSRWAGVDIDPIPGGVTIRVERHVLARLATSGELTLSTTPMLRDQLLTDGFADGVPGRPDRVRYRVRSAADVTGAIRLLRVAYLHRRAARAPHVPLDDHLRRLGASAELVALVVPVGRESA